MPGEYIYLPIERIHFGSDSIAKLGDELQRLRCQNPFVITGQTIAQKTTLLKTIAQASAMRLAGVYSGIRQHTPESDVAEATKAAEEAKADSLVSLGGGSPIDATKIIVKELSENFQRTPLPHIAVPTTLSAAEFSHSAGITDERLNRKTGLRDTRMAPRIIFLDPKLTIPTPAWLWASTGIRSLDHAIEAFCSPKHQPYVDTLALEAIRLLFRHLKKSSLNPADTKSREACQISAWMSYAGAASVGTGLSHALGRAIGATWKIPHGITSCLTLAEVMRVQAKRIPEKLVAIATAEGKSVQGLSTEHAALSAADGVAELVQELGLSKRLRDFRIEKLDLPKIAGELGSPELKGEGLSVLERIW